MASIYLPDFVRILAVAKVNLDKIDWKFHLLSALEKVRFFDELMY